MVVMELTCSYACGVKKKVRERSTSYSVLELLAIVLLHTCVQARTATKPMIRAGREVLFVSISGMDKEGMIQVYAGGLAPQLRTLWGIPRISRV